MEKTRDRRGRHKKLLVVWCLLAIVMAAAITGASVSIITSQVKSDRDMAVTGAAKLAAKEAQASENN